MNKTKNKKSLLVIIGIILAIAIVLFFWRFFYPQTIVDSTSKTLPDGTAVINRTNSKTEDINSNNLPNNSSIEINITQLSQDPNQFVVRALVQGAKTGECTLTLKKDSTIVTKIGAIATGPSYYHCNGFNINKSELPQSGQWQLSLQVSSEGRKNSVTQEITVE